MSVIFDQEVQKMVKIDPMITLSIFNLLVINDLLGKWSKMTKYQVKF